MPVHACAHTHTHADTPRDTRARARAHTHTHTYIRTVHGSVLALTQTQPAQVNKNRPAIYHRPPWVESAGLWGVNGRFGQV